jgi:hypothetical protein
MFRKLTILSRNLAISLILALAVVTALPRDVVHSSGDDSPSGAKWSGRGGVSVTVYDATITPGLGDAIVAAISEWNLSPRVDLSLTRVPGDCSDRTGSIVICEVEDCGGYWALITTKGKNQISKVRIGLMAGCGDWAFRDAASRLNAACHELGHALGLSHRELTSPTCMAHNASTAPDSVDYATLEQMYGGKK